MSDTALKHLYGLPLAESLAQNIATIHPPFPASDFLRDYAAQYEALELKGRVRALANLLGRYLPADYPQALQILLGVMGPAKTTEADIFADSHHIWVLTDYVETYGLGDFERSMTALYELTKRATAEFAIRPFIIRYPEQSLALLETWAHDPNLHVRRLVSEGTRPRLPWAPQLKAFIADPTPTLRLLEILKDDPEHYVRQSVANHLKDISKDHPDRLMSLMETWQIGATSTRWWIICNALRPLFNIGNDRALAILGHKSGGFQVRSFYFNSEAISLGETLVFRLRLHNFTPQTRNAKITYCIHFIEADGEVSPQIFELKTLNLGPGETKILQKSHPLRVTSSHKYYPGKHQLDIKVNGETLLITWFELLSL
jgi:3-methyladenine DNA glycosylase AlkC